jgi:hypothetical protein
MGNMFTCSEYDLSLVKKIEIRNVGKKQLSRRGGRGGAGGRGEEGGQGGAGGQGGGFGGGSSESVAAFGNYVYVLQDATLHKLAAKGLKPERAVELKLGNDDQE